jgi:BON domain-containing protein
MKRQVTAYGSVLLGMAILAAAGCTRPRNDAQIAGEVQSEIYADAGLHNRQITVQSSNGIVTLYGSATSDGERFAAAGDAATVAGVKTVVNNLQVSSAPQAQAAAPTRQTTNTSVAAGPAPINQSQPAAQPSAGASQHRVESADARHSRTHDSTRTAARRVVAQNKKAAKPAHHPAETANNQGSGLPYITAGPPSSPVGATPLPAPTAATRTTTQTSTSSTGPKVAANPSPTNSTAVPMPAAPAAKPVAIAAAPVPPTPTKPVTIAAGTSITVRLLDRIDTGNSHPGDKFRATLDAPLADDSGATVIPAGYEVTGKIVDAKSAGRFAGSSALALELTQLSVDGKQYSLQTNQYTRRGKSRGKSTAEKVGGGAALGAVLGGLFGGAKGAAIGATVGAGAGTGISATSKGQQIVLPSETVLGFDLQSPLAVMPITQSPHGNRQQGAANTTTTSTNEQADGPPVLKRRN